MILYKCRKCGAVFEEAEIITRAWREYRGECFGYPAYETVSEDRCPKCYETSIDEFWESENDDDSEGDD